MDGSLLAFLSTQILQAPYLAIYIVGLALAFGSRLGGNAATLARLGFGILIVTWFANAAFRYWSLQLVASHDFPAMRRVSMNFVAPLSILSVAGLGLVVAAVFAGRRRP